MFSVWLQPRPVVPAGGVRPLGRPLAARANVDGDRDAITIADVLPVTALDWDETIPGLSKSVMGLQLRCQAHRPIPSEGWHP